MDIFGQKYVTGLALLLLGALRHIMSKVFKTNSFPRSFVNGDRQESLCLKMYKSFEGYKLRLTCVFETMGNF